MENILQLLNRIIWGVPGVCAILGVGGYFSIKTAFAQIRLLPNGVHIFCKRTKSSDSGNHDITPYQAFCTALGATVGTGNIAGVAGAIAIGGPGAVFWMWISGIFGMITKYVEVLLAVHYQSTDGKNRTVAGPMYILMKAGGNKWKVMAYFYAAFGVVASFGIGNSVQFNTIIGSLQSTANIFGGSIPKELIWGLGIGAALLVGKILLGGAKEIVKTTQVLVPVVCLTFILLCASALIARWQMIDDALSMIIRGAFSPYAATGGVLGSLMQTIHIGASRGVFTNEAGLGTAGIVHGCAKVEHPAVQGVLGIVEVFVDTIVICTMTALVILCSGIPIPYGYDTGSDLTLQALTSIFGNWTTILLTSIITCLAFATIMGWSLYGARCAQFIFGERSWKFYVLAQAVATFVGAITKTPTIWLFAEVINGFMMVPNLIGLISCSGMAVKLTQEYMHSIRQEQKLHLRKNIIYLK